MLFVLQHMKENCFFFLVWEYFGSLKCILIFCNEWWMIDIAKCALTCSWLLTQEIKLVKAEWFVFTVHILGNAKGETFAPRLLSHLTSLQLELLLKASTISVSFLWSLLLWGGQGRGNPQKQFQSLLPSVQHSSLSLHVVRKLFAFGSLMSFLLTLHVEMLGEKCDQWSESIWK